MTFIQDDTTTQLLRNNEPLPIPPQNLRVGTWFLQNQRGEVIAVDEAAAWHMLQPNKNIGTNPPVYKIVGVSNASIYAKAVEEINKNKALTPIEVKELLKKAFADELEEAKKFVKYPKNPNLLDISGRPIADPTVLSNLPR